MQEIVDRVFIETQYPGVTLGAINRQHGLILVDSPFRQDDARSWRSTLLNLGGGVARLLIQMDAHMDRTMGAKAMECTILSHLEAASVFQNRPASIKAQTTDAGAEWEKYNGLGSIRWGTPHITFSDQMMVHWDDSPIQILYKPGIAEGSIWVELTNEKVIFLGDSVIRQQVPFLGDANLPLWIEHLKMLTSNTIYQDYFMVSGRNGLVTMEDVHNQAAFLVEVHTQLQSLSGAKNLSDSINKLVPDLIKKIVRLPANQVDLNEKRLAFGLQSCYMHHYSEKSFKKDN
ncbi:MAG: hypothetical protein CVU39_26270 [Chloroflexi bacterium HGW-Chloroflexi-10]|nr:MAG: hypothetical protein CVU39_26270 [Chloroflexi bacterium HGW-Chloroflexi-10]